MRRWLRQKIKRWLNLYDIADLQIGAHCGCCGAWMSDTIIEIYWPWSICQRCIDIPDEAEELDRCEWEKDTWSKADWDKARDGYSTSV